MCESVLCVMNDWDKKQLVVSKMFCLLIIVFFFDIRNCVLPLLRVEQMNFSIFIVEITVNKMENSLNWLKLYRVIFGIWYFFSC